MYTPVTKTTSFFRSHALTFRCFPCRVLAVLTLACTACGATSTSLSTLSPSTTVNRQAPRQITSKAWEQIALPVPLLDVHGVAVSPVDPATLFACTAHLPQTDEPGDVAAHAMTLWRTTDAGAHWTAYSPMLSSGTECRIAFAIDDPRRVAIQVVPLLRDSQPCTHDTFYLTANLGATWHRLPEHSSIASTTVSGECFLQVTRHHLYLTYAITRSPQGPQVSLLERSDDTGNTWARIDRGLGDTVLFSPPDIGPNDTLAVMVTPVSAQMPASPPVTTLWMSNDAGSTWKQMSTLLQGAGTFLLSSLALPAGGGNTGTMWPTPAHPFYALEHEQVASNWYEERVQISGDGTGWTLLPPMPVPGADRERPGILQALGVLADGRLVVWGPDPLWGVPQPEMARQEPVPAFWIWLWDPAISRWQNVASPLEITAYEGCGLCWQSQIVVTRDGATYLYVARFDTRMPGGTDVPGIFRIRLVSHN